MDKLKLGPAGEEEGSKFLKSLGYRIICRNFRTRSGEIDIIARKGRELVFIEVKTRSSFSFGHPEEAVSPRKISRLLKAAGFYLSRCEADTPYRFEILSVMKDGENGFSFDIIPFEL